MQHKFGKPLHRSTEWRRKKKGGDGRKGRRWTSQFRDAGFLGFATAVISLINRNGCVGYGELFKLEKSPTGGGNRSYWRDETSDGIFSQLANSDFPPAMVAVAACMIGKLNKKTRRGAKPINLRPDEKAFAKLKESSKQNTAQSFERELRRQKFEASLKQNHIKKAVRERYLAAAQENKFRDTVVSEYIRQYETPYEKRAHGRAPMAESSKGTPPHQIDYLNGAILTRQMASYWRKHHRFPKCARFIDGLLTQTRPSFPSGDFFAMPPDYYVNGEFQTSLKVLKMEQARTFPNLPTNEKW